MLTLGISVSKISLRTAKGFRWDHLSVHPAVVLHYRTTPISVHGRGHLQVAKRNNQLVTKNVPQGQTNGSKRSPKDGPEPAAGAMHKCVYILISSYEPGGP